MKLKTLKDISDFCDEEGCNTPSMANREQLKQEAIKWIKSLDKSALNPNSEGLKSYDNKITGLVATIEWIKYFFNITNEDLK